VGKRIHYRQRNKDGDVSRLFFLILINKYKDSKVKVSKVKEKGQKKKKKKKTTANLEFYTQGKFYSKMKTYKS